MELLTTREFNGVSLDCYKADNERDGFWVTREQIGRLLEYSNPRDAIAKIHQRNQERLDKFSGVVKLSTPEGGSQNTTVYNFKGFLEICRFSNQPKADAVMDFAWSVMDGIRRTGFYATYNKSPEEIIFEQARVMLEHSRRLAAIEDKVNTLETKIETRPADYYTVAGYASLRGVKVDVSKANMLGRRAAKLSRLNDYEIGKTQDARYGSVNTYHQDILKTVFEEVR